MWTERYFPFLYTFLNETIPSAIARVWTRVHLRRLYPDERERKEMAQREYAGIYSENFKKISAAMPWVWAGLFVGFIALLIAVTFAGE